MTSSGPTEDPSEAADMGVPDEPGAGSTGSGVPAAGAASGPTFGLIGESSIYQGSLISVARRTIAAPDGSSFERDVVHHPGAVSIVPFLEQTGEVVMVRQYRAAIDGELLEIPAGKRDLPG